MAFPVRGHEPPAIEERESINGPLIGLVASGPPP